MMFLASLAGFSFGTFLMWMQSMFVTSTEGWTNQNSAIEFALQSTQVRPPSNFHTNAFSKPLAPTSSSVNDVRDALRSSHIQKCAFANKYASVCGNLVFLRPSTAVRASNDRSEVSINVDEFVQGLADKVDAIEDKPQAAIYAGSTVVALVLANGLLTTIDGLPLIPKLLRLVGTGYTGWFTYRYLLRKDSRMELMQDIEKLTGR